MKEFDFRRVNHLKWDSEIAFLISQIKESQKKLNLYQMEKTQLLDKLMEDAKMELGDHSNNPERALTTSTRWKEIIFQGSLPRDNDEEEMLRYSNTTDDILENYENIPVTSQNILFLYRKLYGKPANMERDWLKKNHFSFTMLSDELDESLASPVGFFDSMGELHKLCKEYHLAICQNLAEPLLMIPIFISDFIYLHPFRMGNENLAILLMILLLCQAGYPIEKYTKIEKVIENYRWRWLDSLSHIERGWQDNTCDCVPFIKCFLKVIWTAYRIFEERILIIEEKRTHYWHVKVTVSHLRGRFHKRELQNMCPSIDKFLVSQMIKKLVEEGYIFEIRRGPRVYYKKYRFYPRFPQK